MARILQNFRWLTIPFTAASITWMIVSTLDTLQFDVEKFLYLVHLALVQYDKLLAIPFGWISNFFPDLRFTSGLQNSLILMGAFFIPGAAAASSERDPMSIVYWCVIWLAFLLILLNASSPLDFSPDLDGRWSETSLTHRGVLFVLGSSIGLFALIAFVIVIRHIPLEGGLSQIELTLGLSMGMLVATIALTSIARELLVSVSWVSFAFISFAILIVSVWALSVLVVMVRNFKPGHRNKITYSTFVSMLIIILSGYIAILAIFLVFNPPIELAPLDERPWENHDADPPSLRSQIIIYGILGLIASFPVYNFFSFLFDHYPRYMKTLTFLVFMILSIETVRFTPLALNPQIENAIEWLQSLPREEA